MLFYLFYRLLVDRLFFNSFSLLNISSSPINFSFLIKSLLIVLLGYLNLVDNYLVFIIIFFSVIGLFWMWELFLEFFLSGYSSSNWFDEVIFGFILFVISEIMLFSGFIGSYLSNMMCPSISISGVWPPFFLEVMNPYSDSLLGTLLLLTSGVTISSFHSYLELSEFYRSIIYLFISIFLGVWFKVLQLEEFTSLSYSLSCSVYGSYFYTVIGLHGKHVVIGLLLLSFIFIMLIFNILFNSSSLMLCSLIYWHFVDVVWIIVYIVFYVINW